MREDYIEALEKMFPKGFLLLTRVDDDTRHIKCVLSKSSNNPSLALLFMLIQKFIKENRDDAERQ